MIQIADDLELYHAKGRPMVRFVDTGIDAGPGRLDRIVRLGYAGLVGTPAVTELTDWLDRIKSWQASDDGDRARVVGDDRWICANLAWQIIAWRIEEVRQMTDRKAYREWRGP